MKLKDIFSYLKIGKKNAELKVEGVSDDSRAVAKGDIFFVYNHKHFDIFSVVKSIESKVCAFVIDEAHKHKLRRLIKTKPIIAVANIKNEFERVVDIFYPYTKKDLKIIGVTGTNGKTTLCFCIYYILKSLGQKVSLLGTIKNIIGKNSKISTHTTPGFLDLRKIIKEVIDSKSNYLVMEVSSHSIAQNRIKGLEFYQCIFTNLSRDHLDYHKTMSNYLKVKMKLFLQNKNALSIINTDDISGKRIYAKIKKRVSYGINSKAIYKIQNINLAKIKSKFNIIYKLHTYPVTINLCGKFNILNITASFACVCSLGFDIKCVARAVSRFFPVEGRLEKCAKNIFVDYAHTPDALEKALLALKEIGYGGVICVFGCGGNRDKGKRAIMGEIASKLADFTFITSDNPRDEDPKIICNHIEKGFLCTNYSIVIDRKKAIIAAIKLLSEHNSDKFCILIAGKGHEDYQIVGKKRIVFKDSEIIKYFIKKQKQ